MDYPTDITSGLGRASLSRHITQLVDGLEKDGYLIGADEKGEGYWVKMAEGPTPDVCGLMRLNDACSMNPAIRNALLPWLLKHRPYTSLQRRVALQKAASRDQSEQRDC